MTPNRVSGMERVAFRLICFSRWTLAHFAVNSMEEIIELASSLNLNVMEMSRNCQCKQEVLPSNSVQTCSVDWMPCIWIRSWMMWAFKRVLVQFGGISSIDSLIRQPSWKLTPFPWIDLINEPKKEQKTNLVKSSCYLYIFYLCLTSTTNKHIWEMN